MTVGRRRRDWLEWHRAYDRAGSPLAVRLAIVQSHIGRVLDEAPPGEIRTVSLCAGQGRDVIGAVRGHHRSADVRARLVELDQRNAAIARELAGTAGLVGLEVVTGDASVSDAFLGAAPALLVLVCGVFGNVADGDIRRCIGLLPMLCEHGATVIWTRHRRPPDLTATVRAWFTEAGFEELAWEAPGDAPFIGVGVHRWPGERGVVRSGERFFRFVGDPVIEPGTL